MRSPSEQFGGYVRTHTDQCPAQSATGAGSQWGACAAGPTALTRTLTARRDGKLVLTEMSEPTTRRTVK
jgi:hypothetical protein